MNQRTLKHLLTCEGKNLASSNIADMHISMKEQRIKTFSRLSEHVKIDAGELAYIHAYPEKATVREYNKLAEFFIWDMIAQNLEYSSTDYCMVSIIKSNPQALLNLSGMYGELFAKGFVSFQDVKYFTDTFSDIEMLHRFAVGVIIPDVENYNKLAYFFEWDLIEEEV